MSVLLEFGEKNIILEATAEDFFKNISSAHSEAEVKSIKVSYDSKIAAAKRSFWMSYGKERAESDIAHEHIVVKKIEACKVDIDVDIDSYIADFKAGFMISDASNKEAFDLYVKICEEALEAAFEEAR